MLSKISFASSRIFIRKILPFLDAYKKTAEKEIIPVVVCPFFCRLLFLTKSGVIISYP